MFHEIIGDDPKEYNKINQIKLRKKLNHCMQSLSLQLRAPLIKNAMKISLRIT